jgi:subtilase family serine protease
MNNQSEFDRLLLGQTEPFATSLPWEKDRLSLDVTKLATPLAPILTDAAGTLAENFLASGSYAPSALIGQSLLLGPQVSSFELLGISGLGAASAEAVGQTLDQLILSEAKTAAIAAWVAVGITEADRSLLETVQITVTDLPSQILGQANGYQISIDNDAAGAGWDVDLTTLANANTGKQRVDLLTLVTHEFGHVLGFGHSAQGIMASTLPIGVRLAPTSIDLQQTRLDIFVTRNDELQATDLAILDYRVQDNPDWTKNVAVSWTIKNLGDLAASSYHYGIYASRDTSFDSNDKFISNKQYYNLSPNGTVGDSYINNDLVNLTGRFAGDGYLLLVVDTDNNIVESNENNNTVSIPIPISLPGADFLIPEPAVVPSQIQIGQRLNVDWKIKNVGTVDSRSYISSTVYLSNDNILDISDITVGESNVIGLAVGQEAILNSVLAIPSDVEAGNKYLLFVANGYGFAIETSEYNNTVASPVNLLAPDLVVSNFTAPNLGVIGGLIDIDWSLINTGILDFPAGSFESQAIISKDSIFGNDDDIIAGYFSNDHQIINANGGIYNGRNSLYIPVNLSGIYNLFLTTNTYKGNGIKPNNVSNPISIQILSPDLAVSNVIVPEKIVVGTSTIISALTTNNGLVDSPASTSIYDAVYLSRDDVFGNADDRVITSYARNPRPQLSANDGNYTQNYYLSIPSDVAGRYNLFLSIDDTKSQGDSDRTNNISSPIPINIIAPNLRIESFDVPETVVQGSYFDIKWTVKNIGGSNTVGANWKDKVYISKDNILDASDQQIDDADYQENANYYNPVTSLAVESIYSKTRNIKLTGLTDGIYYLIAAADRDGQQIELDETNNTAVSVPVSIITGDLQLSSFGAYDNSNNPLTSVDFGSPFNVKWSVNNLSSNTVDGTWRDIVYLSVDDKISSDDRVVFGKGQTKTLLSDSEYQDNATISIPITSTLPIDINGFLNENTFPGNDIHDSIATAKDIQGNFLDDFTGGYTVKIKGQFDKYNKQDYYKISSSPLV